MGDFLCLNFELILPQKDVQLAMEKHLTATDCKKKNTYLIQIGIFCNLSLKYKKGVDQIMNIIKKSHVPNHMTYDYDKGQDY